MHSVADDIGAPPRLRPAVDGYVALGSVAFVLTAIHVANALAGEHYTSSAAIGIVGAYYGLDGLAVWVALKLATYGLLGVGATALYADLADVDVSAALPTRDDARLAAGLAGVAVAAVGAAKLVTPLVGYSLTYLLGNGLGQAAGVMGPGNPAPDALVLGTVVATRALVVAPGLAVVAHGILQSTLSESAGPLAGVAGAVLVLAVTMTPVASATASTSLVVALVAAVLVAVVATAAGLATERTGSLVLPVATYALFVLGVHAGYYYFGWTLL